MKAAPLIVGQLGSFTFERLDPRARFSGQDTKISVYQQDNPDVAELVELGIGSPALPTHAETPLRGFFEKMERRNYFLERHATLSQGSAEVSHVLGVPVHIHFEKVVLIPKERRFKNAREFSLRQHTCFAEMQGIELVPVRDNLRPPIADSPKDLAHFLKIFVPQHMKVARQACSRMDISVGDGRFRSYGGWHPFIPLSRYLMEQKHTVLSRGNTNPRQPFGADRFARHSAVPQLVRFRLVGIGRLW